MVMNQTYTIRQLRKDEAHKLQKVIKPVFTQFVAPIFSAEGIQYFLHELRPTKVQERFTRSNRVALVAETISRAHIVGVLEIKNYAHISLFFVKSKLQGQGIGRALLQRCIALCKRKNPQLKKITVCASPNAVEIYRKLGFSIVGKGKVQQKQGLRFVKMKLGIVWGK